jgi:hypothetical protein
MQNWHHLFASALRGETAGVRDLSLHVGEIKKPIDLLLRLRDELDHLCTNPCRKEWPALDSAFVEKVETSKPDDEVNQVWLPIFGWKNK